MRLPEENQACSLGGTCPAKQKTANQAVRAGDVLGLPPPASNFSGGNTPRLNLGLLPVNKTCIFV